MGGFLPHSKSCELSESAGKQSAELVCSKAHLDGIMHQQTIIL